MAFSVLKVKSLLTQKKGRLPGSGSLEPEIGLRVVANPTQPSELKVTLIGARHLPSRFGLTSSKGYRVKVKVFPGDAKYESEMQDTSWPVWNQDFTFKIDGKRSKKGASSSDMSMFNGYFVSLTVYAILEVTAPAKEDKKKDDKKKTGKTTTTEAQNAQNTVSNEPTSTFAKFERLMSTSFKGTSKSSQGSVNGPDKRRMVGVATWTFDLKLFQNSLKDNTFRTPDIWRPIEQMGTGLAPPNGIRENKKGQVEITMLYTNSEDGCKDTIQVNVNKMRCTVQTMQEHEIHKEPLYIKAAISDREHESHWKSDRFFPTISARWDPKTSCARLRFDSRNLSNVTVYVSIGCKNSMGVKEILGKVVVGEKTPFADIWRDLTDSPGVSKTHWLPFE